MHRLTLRAVGLGAGLGAIAVAAIMLVTTFGGGSITHTAHANLNTPTPTTGPAPTAKNPAAGGTLTGIGDIIVDGSVGPPLPADAFHCISYTQDRGNTTVKTAAVCFSNTGLLANNDAEPLNDASGEGTSDGGTCVTNDCAGPPPPPPFSPAAPAKGAGTLIGDNLDSLTCFPELGPPSGPNIIARLRVTGAVSQLNTLGYQHALVDVYYSQTDAACAAAENAGTVPGGAPTLAGLGATVYQATDNANCPASNCTQSPFRGGAPSAGGDFDADGCTDQAELDKLDATKCGDDPWNPNDTNLLSTDVAGDYSLEATVTDADVAAPGLYYPCLASIEQTGKTVKAFVNCYIDSPGLPINPQVSTNCTLVGAGAGGCGDGFPGSPPPGITASGCSPNACIRNFADVDTKTTELTGVVDNTKNTLNLQGCFEDIDGNSPLGYVYVKSQTDLHTGHGFVEIYAAQSMANCTGGTPSGTPGDAPLDIVRQRKHVFPMRDSDSDGCGDAREMGDPGNTTSAQLAATHGGLRDPSNHYDYMNPTHDGVDRVDDIIAVVNKYHADDTDASPGFPPFTAGYNQDVDRTAIAGGNAWNLGAPNGLVRVDDILAEVKQYHHDCVTTNYTS